ncbi:serine/threonine-protein kinase [Herbidospora daliensis]|uniref:serine/threonine-protein kinase n=1 Tax=Herbidospora daliensis TaxID=295585 RepID=UPI000A4163E8|nr:serine/threonine-protein kinase [Herbidospora daliensis]
MIGGHRIVGRLGEGGQGVVYLGESPSGERVAVKVLRDGDAEAFLAESEMVRRVRTFCTAQVLETGVADGSPYIVSEYVDGPSLALALAERGPLRGAELGRLAIGTMTALAAIHRAGVVHRDFKPANVLLGRDGPRVIDFGIAQLGDSAAVADVVGTPPYMAPEQFRGGPAGSAADLFAWGSTIVCAATGRPPFGTEPVPAVVNRILTREPDLTGLDGELRDLVEACLDKDPAARPTAQAALMRLLGETTVPGEPGRPRRPRSWWIALLIAAGVTAAVVLTRPDAPAAAPPRAPAVVVAPVVARPMAATATVEVEIASVGVTLHENPADGLWASSYEDTRDGGGNTGYVRDPGTGAFTSAGALADVRVSPGGQFVAVFPGRRLFAPDFDFVQITDRRSGTTREVDTVSRPELGRHPVWSGDGSTLLMSTGGTEDGDSVTGFVLVDAVKGTSSVVRVAAGGTEPFRWGPEKGTLARETGGTTTVYTLTGEVVRELTGTGDLHATRDGLLLTGCAAGRLCVLDAATGAERRRFPLAKGLSVGGWLDDDHVMATRIGEDRFEVVLLDLDGKQLRLLAEGPESVYEGILIFWTTR